MLTKLHPFEFFFQKSKSKENKKDFCRGFLKFCMYFVSSFESLGCINKNYYALLINTNHNKVLRLIILFFYILFFCGGGDGGGFTVDFRIFFKNDIMDLEIYKRFHLFLVLVILWE